MLQIAAIISARTQQRHAEAVRLAGAALGALAANGIHAWLVGSLARGDFRKHSDIDILIDAPVADRALALRLRLSALGDFPSSVLFVSDLPDSALVPMMAEATREPGLRR